MTESAKLCFCLFLISICFYTSIKARFYSAICRRWIKDRVVNNTFK